MENFNSDKSPLSGPEDSEGELVARIKKGDEEAFEKIYQRYCQKIHVYARRITHCQFIAEEMVQEVFLKIWLNRNNLNPDLNFGNYLLKTTRNTAINHLRKVASDDRLKHEQSENAKHAKNETEDTLTFEEYRDLMQKAVEKLSPKIRVIYILSREQGKSNEEIAAELGISLKTVQNNIALALKAIKANLPGIVEITLPLLLFAFFL